MPRLLRALASVVAVFVASACEPVRSANAAASPFADWAAVVVAGDNLAGNGKPTAAFDNARRDVSAILLASGFRRENLKTFAVGATASDIGEAHPETLIASLSAAAARAKSGCLVYITSHGSPEGVVLGRAPGRYYTLAPTLLANVLNSACGQRPTVVYLSACYSGAFVQPLAAGNRLIVTAARRDRTSFGCGEDDVYPFFDGCVLESFPRASDFLALGRAVQTCVARRETELKLSPASEPQISVGARIRPLLPLLPLHARALAS